MKIKYTVFTCGATFADDIMTTHETAAQARKEARKRGARHYMKLYVLPNGIVSHWKHYPVKS